MHHMHMLTVEHGGGAQKQSNQNTSEKKYGSQRLIESYGKHLKADFIAANIIC